jgi:hypothetical protein
MGKKLRIIYSILILGDLKEARRRWDITRHWRETEGVNTALETKQPHYSLIKSMYPFYHAGKVLLLMSI